MSPAVRRLGKGGALGGFALPPILVFALLSCASGRVAPYAASHPASPAAGEAPRLVSSLPKSGEEPAVASPPSNPVAGASYTCVMHPEVVRDAPGACPICGMALRVKSVKP